MSANGKTDNVIQNTVTHFPNSPREAWLQVERYRDDRDQHPGYGTALNLQVATAHWRKVRNAAIQPA